VSSDAIKNKYLGQLLIAGYFGGIALVSVFYMRKVVREIVYFPNKHRIRITTIGFPHSESTEYATHSIIPPLSRIASSSKPMQPLIAVEADGKTHRQYIIVPTYNTIQGTGKIIGDCVLSINSGDGLDYNKVMKGNYIPKFSFPQDGVSTKKSSK
jgi:hypothetical protein